MNIPILGRLVDERFFERRRRATSIAGVTGGVLSILLFAYHYYIDHFWSWDLFIVGVTFVAVKMAVMGWYLLTD
jgi:hypothetical protein